MCNGLVANKSPGACSCSFVIYESLVGILCLEKTAFLW